MGHYDAFVVDSEQGNGSTVVKLVIDGVMTPDKGPRGETCIVLTGPHWTTARQRRTFYALVTDIADAMGEGWKEGKRNRSGINHVKRLFLNQIGLNRWRDCERAHANTAIDIMLEFCKQHDITLKHETWQDLELKQQYDVAMWKKICIVCGKRADMHHADPVGMGRDRNEVELDAARIPACREHHSELHTIGRDDWEAKYCLTGLYDIAIKKASQVEE